MKLLKTKKIKAYSILEILVTLVIFGILSVFLMQSLFNNLTISSRISARSQIRSELDQTLSLMEKDFRNAEDINTKKCGITNNEIIGGVSCLGRCVLNTNEGLITWCFSSNDKKIYKFVGNTTVYKSSDLFDVTTVDFTVNVEQDIVGKDFTPYANILVTVNAENNALGITNQIRQLSITTRNYIIK